MAKLLGVEIEDERVKYVRIAIEHKDEEILQSFFKRKLTEEEKEKLYKEVINEEERIRKEKQIRRAEQRIVEIKKYSEDPYSNLTEEQIEAYLKDFETSDLSNVEKELIKEKLFIQKLKINRNILEEISNTFKTKTSFYDFIANYIVKSRKDIVYDEIERCFFIFSEENSWMEHSEIAVKKEIKNILGPAYSTTAAKEILENLILLAPRTSMMQAPLHLIPVQNGLYDIKG